MIGTERDTINASVEAFEARLVGPRGPFELERQSDGVRRFRTGADSLSEVYARARRMGDKPLIVTEAGRADYSLIFETGLAIAGRLHREGRTGQRIALLLDDGPAWLTWFVAITAAGASCLLPPSDASDDLIAGCLASGECTSVVATPGHAAIGCAENLNAVGINDSSTGGYQPAISPEAEALVVFTSGSSGVPKGVVHSHRSLLSGLRNMMLGGALSSHLKPPAAPQAPGSMRPQVPATLVLAPLSYIAGYSAFLLTITGGGKIVLAPDAGPDRIARIVERESIQSIIGASVELVRQLIRLPTAAAQLGSLKRLQLHGEGLQRGLVAETEAALPNLQLMTGYGMTETAGSIATAPVSSVIGTPWGCGRLLPSVDLRIMGDGDCRLPFGENGQVQVRGDMLMRGYLDPARTAEAFTADGWFITGDWGSVDAFGWLSIIGRDRGVGEDFTAPTEEAMRALPGVDDAAVTSSTDGRTLFAFLQGKADSQLDRAEAASTLRGLTRWSGEIDVRPVRRLPRTASGKVDKRALVRSVE